MDEGTDLLVSLRHFTSAEVIGRTILTPSAVDRVLEAPQLPYRGPEVSAEAARKGLAIMADKAWGLLAEPAPAPQAEIDDVRAKWLKFARAASKLAKTADALPAPELLVPIGEWVSDLPKRGRGTRANQLDNVIYPCLLAFFHAVYGERPKATRDGAAYRFLQAFNREFASALRVGSWMTNGKPIKAPTWQELNPDTLVKKIERHTGDEQHEAWALNILGVVV